MKTAHATLILRMRIKIACIGGQASSINHFTKEINMKKEEYVEIKNRITGDVILNGPLSSKKEVIEDETVIEKFGSDISGLDLQMADLSGIDLSGYVACYTHFRGTNLAGADLSGIDLRHSDLSGADLSGANLQDADLRFCEIDGADFRDADLRGADFRYANIEEAIWDSRLYDARER